jgi:hypothetical protein
MIEERFFPICTKTAKKAAVFSAEFRQIKRLDGRPSRPYTAACDPIAIRNRQKRS